MDTTAIAKLFFTYFDVLWIFFELLDFPISSFHFYILEAIRHHLSFLRLYNIKKYFLNGDVMQIPTTLPPRARKLLSSMHLNAAFLLFSLEQTYLELNLPEEAKNFQSICIMLMSHELFQLLKSEYQELWSDSQLLYVLRRKFNLPNFRPNQLEVIRKTLGATSVIGLMPTGHGKSLLYMLPCSIEYGISLLFSPLCSLIADQERRLKSLGINAVSIVAGMDSETEQTIRRNLSLRFPPYSIVLITPEKFLKSTLLRNLFHCLHSRGILRRIIIDECHTLSLWGHSFRPSYIDLCRSLNDFLGINYLCLTATADGAILKDLKYLLKLEGATIIRESFNRPNLQFILKDKTKNIIEECVALVQTNFGGKSGIMFCRTCREAESISKTLNEKGIKSAPYHSKLEEKKKREAVTLWMGNVVQLVVATIAFGLGIDKPDVRFVLLHSIPSSAENFMQLCGRAGNVLEVDIY